MRIEGFGTKGKKKKKKRNTRKYKQKVVGGAVVA